MPSFLWLNAKGFVLDTCPVCRNLYEYQEGDLDLKSIFGKDCKIKRILKRQGFNLENPIFKDGMVWFERLKRGFQLRRELALKRSRPDYMVDLDTKRLIRIVREYGVEYVRNAIFIERFEVINLSHPKRTPLMFLWHVRLVPAFMSPYSPNGIMRGVSSEEPEDEIEKLLFTGGSCIRPAEEVVTRVM